MRRSSGWLSGVTGLLVLLAGAGACLAQGGDESVPGGEQLSMTLLEMFEKGGWVMYVLAGMSVLAVAFVIYLLIILRPEQVVPRVFRKDLLAKIRGGSFDDVQTACNYRPCPLSEVTLAALDFVRSSPQADPAMVKDIMEGEGERQALAIQGPPQYLLDIAVIAPMVGLFGTVIGMLRAFQVVALDIAKAKPMLLADGVSQALITTAFGLLVGIPTMMFYAYFRGRATKIVSYLEAASGEVLTAILRARGA